MVDILGPELGGVVLNGAPGHYLGVDLVNRIGMADVWLRSPQCDLQGREEYMYWVHNMAGASIAMIGEVRRGVSLIKEGNVARGFEVLAPKWANDQMRVWRYYNEGLTNLRADEVLPRDEIDAWDLIAQSLGFTPARIVETYERNNALRNAETRIVERRRRLVNAYALAATQKDEPGKAAAMERIETFNAKPVHAGVRITDDTLRRSMKNRARLAEKRQDGMVFQNEELGAGLRRQPAETVYR